MRKLTVLEMDRISEEEFHRAKKLPLTVVLDNVRSQHNVGSVFRTADAFRIEKIILTGICCCPPNPDIHKTALGAENSVDWSYEADSLKAVRDLQKEGYTVFAIEQAEGSQMLSELKLKTGGKYAIVLGHEVKGVRQEVVDAADGCIEIPQYGTKHSLNVSVAAGIVLWECFEQLKNCL